MYNKIILRKTLRYARIIKKLPNGKLLVNYYDKNNTNITEVITKSEIISEETYLVIQRRKNFINFIRRSKK